ncbi:MAG TPA: DUF5681 domain-containing protein [Xanthobacteraceae bacterium]|jgi:Family of unknown function (DUF5681)
MHRDKLGRFARGQSGNMTGRPRGSRNKLGEVFITQLYTDWLEHGEAVIATVRMAKPDAYLKVVASLLPKQLEIKEGTFDGLTDEQLAALIAYARNALGFPEGDRAGASAATH